MAATTRIHLPAGHHPVEQVDPVTFAAHATSSEHDRMYRIHLKEIEHVQEQMCQHFRSPLMKQRARLYIHDMVANAGTSRSARAVARTTIDERALVSRGGWDADDVRDTIRRYVAERIASSSGVLIVNELGFRRRGRTVVGVARQVNPASGRIAKMQVGMFLTYAAQDAFAVVDRELFLPEEWSDDRTLRRLAGVPEASVYRTKAMIAGDMLQRALAVDLPAEWVTGSQVLGVDGTFREVLEHSGQRYVLAIVPEQPLLLSVTDEPGPFTALSLARDVAPDDWSQLDVDDSFLSRWDWTRIVLTFPDRENRVRSLVVRRRRDDPADLRFDICFGPKCTTFETIGRVLEIRTASHLALEMACSEVQLGRTRVRRWDGWYRHVTLALVGSATLSIIRARSGTASSAPLLDAVDTVSPVIMEEESMMRHQPGRNGTVMAIDSDWSGYPTALHSTGHAVSSPPHVRSVEPQTASAAGAPVTRLVANKVLTPLLAMVSIFFLLAIVGAELVTAYVNPVTGVVFHILIMVMVAAGSALYTDPAQRAFLLPLMLAPLIRIVSLSLPLGSYSDPWWFLLPSIPLFAGSVIVMRALSLTRTQVGLRLPRRRHVWATIVVACSGVVLGYMEYRILLPVGIVDSASFAVWAFPVAAIFLGSGLLEELMFRGIMQTTAERVFGTKMAIGYVSTLFAILHIGHLSTIDIAFVFAVGVCFGVVVHRTGTLAGVVIAHGLTNVMLFVVLPTVGL